ncbi:MAG: tetratricopeptide repeat protein [Bacteroidetes bacterium]|nr:tetratricopeptide repeat protein [Bacteroidota bacterium]
MKKIFLTLISFLAVSVAVAQVDVQPLLSKLEKSNSYITHPKKSLKVSTWINRGNIYKEIGEANYNKLFIGQPVLVLTSALGQPTNAAAIPLEKIGNSEYAVYEYPNVTVYLDSEKNIAFFNDKNPAMVDAFDNALESYNKAIELNPDKASSVVDELKALSTAYLVRANNNFNLKNHEEAYADYIKSASILDMPFINDPTSAESYLWALYSSLGLGDNEKANIAIDKLLEKDYLMEGMTLYYAGVVKMNIEGLEDASEQMFMRGIQEFPSNKDMVPGLVSLYTKRGDDATKIIPLIIKAQEQNPDDINLIIQEGNAYIAINDFDNAIIAYDKAIVKDPTFFNALYNKGLAYYKMSDKCYKELNDIDYTNVSVAEAKNAEVLKYRKAAVEVFESAFELDSTNKSTIELLRALSFSLRDEDPIYMEKYNKYNELNKAL